jgi:hypothetical protein
MSHDIEYIGLDVHKEGTVIAVLNGSGKLVMESIVETKASSILQFIHGLRGELHVTWEEGAWAACLYELLQPQVTRVLICDPRRNALLKEGNKSDKVDARKLADLLRTGMLRPVYHGEHGLRTLRELGRSYQTISQDLNRVMNRIKALYRGWSIPSKIPVAKAGHFSVALVGCYDNRTTHSLGIFLNSLKRPLGYKVDMDDEKVESRKKPYTSPTVTILGSDVDKAEQLILTHRLNNKLAIILAECALLAQRTSDPGFLMRLETIQKAVHDMGDEIRGCQRRIQGVMRAAAGQ